MEDMFQRWDSARRSSVGQTTAKRTCVGSRHSMKKPFAAPRHAQTVKSWSLTKQM